MSYVRLIYADGTVETLPPSAITDRLTLVHTCDGNIHTLTLTPMTEGIALSFLDYITDIPTSLLEPAEDLRFYDNAQHIVDVSHVYAYADHREHEVKDLAVFKNLTTKEVFLAGMLTAHRFWAAMLLKDDNLIIRHDMEERPLHAGEAYVMERFMLMGGQDNENALLETYADKVALLNNARPTGKLPVGFCSWSCYFDDVNQEKIRRAADMQMTYAAHGSPNLVQIDHGWQAGYKSFFPGDWYGDPDRFPDGMAATAVST